MCRAGKRAPPAPPARPDPRRSPPPVNFPGMPFDLAAPYPPAGDQPRAIRELGQGLVRDDRYQVLLGVTGSGKTFTMAHVVAGFGRPTLVLSHNKTLAAQLYGELKAFFPKSAVEFFISYYDYYQPEAYRSEERRVGKRVDLGGSRTS